MWTPADRLIRFVLLPIAVVAVGLHVAALVHTGLAEPAFFVVGPVASSEYPVVSGFRLDVISPDTPVQIGDRLLRLGDVDLRGAGHLDVDLAAIHQADASGTSRIVWERDGVVHEGDLALAHVVPPWSRTPALLAALAIAGVIVFRGERTAHTRLIAAMILIGIVFQAPYHGLAPALTLASKWSFYLLGGVAPALILYWALRFPPENPAPPRALAVATLGFSVAFLGLRAHFFTGGPLPIPLVAKAITWVNAALFAAILAALVWNFARADALGRRRIKWVLLGCGFGIGPMLSQFLTATDFGVRWYPYVQPWTHVAFVLAPIGVLLALARQSLFDVDRILGVTATATLVAAPLLFGAVTLLRPAEETLAAALDGRHGLARVILVVVLAALAVPLYRLSRPWIERMLVPERAATLRRARESMAEEPSADASFEGVAEQLAHTFGCGAPVLIRPGDPRWPALCRVGSPMLVDRADAEHGAIAVLVPLVQDDETGAVVGLPPKRSGDVFTASDLAWAAAIAEKALRQRALRAEQRLRRFVPANVAEAIRSGVEPAPLETTATVLFADIRGFTAFAERRAPEQVFASLTSFVEATTAVLERHGGVVVELRGDAILAVFDGAREGAAVAAAIELAGSLDGSEPGRGVGVGVATGPVFVGAVRARNRSLWGVIGHAANTAARLEGLTRTLDAAVALDDATFRGAGAAAAGFRRAPEVVLRGQEAPIAVYFMPLQTDDAGPVRSQSA